MSQNGQTHFKSLAAFDTTFLKVCLTILGHYALKSSDIIETETMKWLQRRTQNPLQIGSHFLFLFLLHCTTHYRVLQPSKYTKIHFYFKYPGSRVSFRLVGIYCCNYRRCFRVVSNLTFDWLRMQVDLIVY